MSDRQKFTPPQLAKLWGVDVHTVLGWIHSGELKAKNYARDSHGERPRFKINQEDAEDFDKRRTWRPERRVERRKRARVPMKILQLI